MAANQFPTVPTPSAVSPYSTTNSRVYFDCNITPIVKTYLPWLGTTLPDANGNYQYYAMHEHEKYCLDRGFTPTMVVYNGTVNQATMWSTSGTPDTLTFGVGGANWYSYNQANGNTGSDYMAAASPSTQETNLYYAVEALARLSRDADKYGGTAADYMPIMIDFESSTTFNGNGLTVTSSMTTAEWLAKAERWKEMLTYIRTIVGVETQLFVYGHNELANADRLWGRNTAVNATQNYLDIVRVETDVAHMLSGFVPSTGYMADVEIINPFFWYQRVMNADNDILKYYPQWEHSKIMFINPYYQPSDAGSAYYGDLMPLQLWKDHLAFLVDRGWHLFIWIGVPIAGQTLAQVKPYIDWVAKYQKLGT